MRRLAAVAVMLFAAGCPSAYQRTYDAETARLEAQAQQQRQQQQTLHAQAARYAAVVYFPTGNATVSEDGQRELRWFVQQLQPYPQANVLVQGFADTTGSEAKNQGLSRERAQAVAAYLSAHGIDASRMNVQGYGTGSPAASNTTVKGRGRNRRVEVTVQ